METAGREEMLFGRKIRRTRARRYQRVSPLPGVRTNRDSSRNRFFYLLSSCLSIIRRVMDEREKSVAISPRWNGKTIEGDDRRIDTDLI